MQLRLSDIQIGEKLGAGGFGNVFRATGDHFGATVAIKLLRVEDDSARRRLAREIRLLSSLDHKNIIPILTWQLEGEQVWLTMPLAEESLFQRMIFEKLPVQKVNSYFVQMLDAVQFAHEHTNRIIHRDLKPENILLVGDNLFVSDFGLGKPLEKGGLYSTVTVNAIGMGSRGYSSPEQLTDIRNADERSDIYALGMVLYAMLTNRNPEHIDLSLVPSKYEYIISRCRRREPSKRFASVSELRSAFLTAIDANSYSLTQTVESQLKELLTLECTAELANNVSKILHEYVDNERLYETCFPLMSKDYVEFFVDPSYIEDFKYLLNRFDQYVSGQLQFKYCDDVARLYQLIAETSADLDVYEIVLERLLLMGNSHNRYFVMEVIMKLLCQLHLGSAGQVMIAKEVIERQPEAFRVAYLNKGSLLASCTMPNVLWKSIQSIVG